MNNIREGWKVEEIGNVCEIHDSKRIPLNTVQRRDRKGKYPYFGANNIQDFIDDYIFDFDSVLLAEDGGYYEQYESRDIAQYATGKYWVNNHAHILTGRDCLDTKFLYYFLVRKNICPWINTGTRSKLNQADLRKIKIAFPPLPEQKKIAEILSVIDKSIKLLNKKSLKIQFLIYSFKDSISYLDGKEMNISEIINKITTGVSVNSENKRAGFNKFGVLKTSCIKEGIFSSEEHKEVLFNDIPRLRCPVEKNSIIISRMNTPNLVGEVGYCFQNEPNLYLPDRLWKLKSNPKICNAEFLSYVLSSKRYRSLLTDLATGTSGSMKNISKAQFLDIKIKIPNIDEQKKLCFKIRSLTNRIKLINKQIERLSIIKNGLSEELLTGRIRVKA